MKRSTGQRLAGPYSAPGFKPRIGCVIFSRPNFFFAASISSGETNNCGGDRFRVRAQRGGEMQILVDLMCAVGTWDRRRAVPSCPQYSDIGATPVLLNFCHGPFPHFHRPGARREGLRQEKIPPRPRVTDALRNSGQPGFNRRTRRVRQHQREIKFSGAQFFADSENTFTRGERNRFIDRRMPTHKSRNFSGVSSAMCASGNFSRRRSSAGVVMTASPSQLVPRIRIRGGSGVWRLAVWGIHGAFVWLLDSRLWTVDFVSARFPPAMDPEPVRRVAADGDFQRAVHVAHDVFEGAVCRFRAWGFFRRVPAAISPAPTR